MQQKMRAPPPGRRRLLEELRQSPLVDVLRSVDLRHGGSMPRLVVGK
jgi:hypothetical protein